MAQAKPEREIEETQELEMKKDKNKDNGTSGSFKLNVQAPEFVPRAQTQIPISGYFYPCYQIIGGNGGSDWVYVGDQEEVTYVPNSNVAMPTNHSKECLTHDLQQKIIKQAEYQLSDISLLANEFLVKQMNKDPEGYVPMSFIASTKKMKSLSSNHHLVAQALKSSSKLIMSNEGKKVRRKCPFTDKEREELQSRTVVAENLPDDHSYQNLEKMFNVVGRVKNIRICHPHESNSSRSKGDFVISNKLHALVEYENTDIAEKAVDKLNDERNWRKGLRVRLLLRRSPRCVLKCRKSEFDGYLDDAEGPPFEDSSSQLNINLEGVLDSNAEESSGGSKKGWVRGRGKPRPRTPIHNGRGLLSPSPQPSSSSFIQCESSPKHITKGPRMPDGTKGFTMGRGKPISSPRAASG